MALVNAALSTLEHALVLGLRLCTITAQHMLIIVIKDPLHPVSAKQEGTRHPKATEIEFHTDSMPKYFSLLFTIQSNQLYGRLLGQLGRRPLAVQKQLPEGNI